MKQLLTLALLCICLSTQAVTDTLHWHRLSPLPTEPLTDFGYFVIDSDLYIIGGEDSTLLYRSSVWQYHFPSDTWRRLRDFPGGPTVDMAAFALNGKGYVCAGLDSVQGGFCDSLFWEYDPLVDSWQAKGIYPGPPREVNNSAVFTFGNKAYVGTGIQCGVTYLNDMWEYDAITDSWSQKQSLPADGRSGVSATTCDSFAYLIGGFSISVNGFKDFWRYSIKINHWDSIGELPRGERSSCLSWGFKDAIYMGYGTLSDSNSNISFGKDVYRYNPQTNYWDTLISTGFVDSVTGGGMFVVGNRGYFLGGNYNNNYSFYRDLWCFDLSETIHTGITLAEDDPYVFRVLSSTVGANTPLRVESSERGNIDLYNTIGQQVYSGSLLSGLNVIPVESLPTNSGVLYYRATYRNGQTLTGKVLMLR